MLLESWKRFRSLRIARKDFVAEVGSGSDPYWRSNVLVDKYVADSRERPAGTAPLVIDRPFVVGDVEQLPFRNKSVDFLIARNILEHIIDVERFFYELTRVSRRGYITVPSALAEKLFGWNKHVWFIRSVGDQLDFTAKQSELYDVELNRTFHQLHAEDASFRRFYSKHRHLFVIEFVWEGQIDYTVKGDLDGLPALKTAQAEFDLEGTLSGLKNGRRSQSIRARTAGAARRIASSRTANLKQAVVDRLACPICHGSLDLRSLAGICACDNCHEKFPVVDEIPVLVPDAVIQEQNE